MKIIVGSTNPVKIAAVKNAANKIWPGSLVLGIEAKSGVRDQPMTNKEAIKGAINRAKFSLKNSDFDIGIGLEGCVYESDFGMFLSGWVVAINKKKEIGIGNGGSVLLPEKIASKVRKGKELGLVIDEFIKGHNTKQKQGTVGVLTNNLITRTKSFEKGIIFAFSRFINPDYYK